MSSESCSLAPVFLRGGTRGRSKEPIRRQPIDTTRIVHPSNGEQNNFPHFQVKGDWQMPRVARRCPSLTRLPRHTGHSGIPFYSRRASCITGGNLLNLVETSQLARCASVLNYSMIVQWVVTWDCLRP